MNWLNERYEQERREDEVRAMLHDAEIEALLADAKAQGKAKNKKVRKAVGSKLVEWGERLQDTQSLPKPSTSKI
jgi:hypothetical protein